jgi:hypothetical protein
MCRFLGLRPCADEPCLRPLFSHFQDWNTWNHWSHYKCSRQSKATCRPMLLQQKTAAVSGGGACGLRIRQNILKCQVLQRPKQANAPRVVSPKNSCAEPSGSSDYSTLLAVAGVDRPVSWRRTESGKAVCRFAVCGKAIHATTVAAHARIRIGGNCSCVTSLFVAAFSDQRLLAKHSLTSVMAALRCFALLRNHALKIPQIMPSYVHLKGV